MQLSRPTRPAASCLNLMLALSLFAPLLIFARPAPASLRQQAQEKRALPPPQYIPSRNYDTRHILLNLRFDWEREQAFGTAAITLAPLTVNLRSVEFDAGNMTINSVKLASGAPLRYQADAAAEKLRIELDRAYQPADALTLVIDYRTNGKASGQPARRGLTFIKPTRDEPQRPRQIWSQGEAEENHYWFPCYDHPNDFATTEIIATVEQPFTVISNGRLVGKTANGDGTQSFHWKIEQPHASYLTSIVVGEYKALEASYAGIPVVTYVYPNETEQGKVSSARLAEMVKFFSEKTGVKYPYAKYAQTMVRDFPGAMENISATTMTDSAVRDARSELDQTSDGIMSHELAHQWFGDYVTCRTWADLWLNESFATYFQAMWDEHHLGRDDFLYSDVKSNQDQYYAAWARGVRRPIVTKNYLNPDALFDVYSYPRGAAVLHMLRRALGEDDWGRSLNHYLTKYAHQPVQTEQLRIAIEEATGQSMDWFFDQWVYRMGHPVFRVAQSYNAAEQTLRLNVRQEQKPDPASLFPQAAFFRAPVEIEIGTGTRTRIERVMIEPKEEQTFTFEVDSEPLLVNFDYGDTLIKELNFEKPTARLLYQLTRDEDITGRLRALAALSNRLKQKGLADAEREQISSALAASLERDRFWGVRAEAAAALGAIPAVAPARAALVAATKDADARVRARAVTSLAAAQDPQLAGLYRQLLSDQSYATVRAAALALGQTKSPLAYEALAALAGVRSWRDSLRVSALGGLAALGDKRALEAGLLSVAAENQRPVRLAALALLGAVGKDDPRVFAVVSDTLLQSVASNNTQVGRAAAEALVSLNDPRGVETLEQAARAAGASRLQDLIEQYRERLLKGARPAGHKPGGQ
ncbi:MAG TPA: M1 family aminopeptidase [Pyrinomonadaceae bacterium]|jgi:aminopeptidase N